MKYREIQTIATILDVVHRIVYKQSRDAMNAWHKRFDEIQRSGERSSILDEPLKIESCKTSEILEKVTKAYSEFLDIEWTQKGEK